MKHGFTPALFLALFVAAANAQSVQVYSEFARLSSTGEPVAPETSREILSAAVMRNAYTTFQIAIQAPAGVKYHVFIGQNPENAVKATLYRVSSKLEAVGTPYEGVGSQVLWLDLWVDASAPVRRVKVEPQIYVNGDWVTYPMEVRVSEMVVPDEAVPESAVKELQCGAETRSGAGLRLRNTRQDAALLAHASPAQREAAKAALQGCEAAMSSDPEVYLRLRDLFVSPAWQKTR